jgi:prepilin-type N-terminal cleavage/methylation domain-containing protein
MSGARLSRSCKPIRRRAGESGMSLVEVLVALAILAGVLISVASLFVLGGQRVRSGREMTESTTIASDIMEELVQYGAQLEDLFPDCTTDTGCTVNTNDDSFASSQWASLIDETLYKGRADIILTPIGGTVTPPTFASAEGVRVQVVVNWAEGTVARTVSLETLQF